MEKPKLAILFFALSFIRFAFLVQTWLKEEKVLLQLLASILQRLLPNFGVLHQNARSSAADVERKKTHTWEIDMCTSSIRKNNADQIVVKRYVLFGTEEVPPGRGRMLLRTKRNRRLPQCIDIFWDVFQLSKQGWFFLDWHDCVIYLLPYVIVI